MNARMTMNYLDSDGNRQQVNKMEDMPDNGWYEYAEPLTHGMAGNHIRRFFKNDALKTEIAIEEVFPTNLFQAPYLITWIDYVSPNGLIYFVTDGEDCFGELSKIDQHDYVSFPDERALPEDAEFDALLKALFDGEDHSSKFHAMGKLLGQPAVTPSTMRDVLVDIYGRWGICMKVQAEECAFKLAEFFTKRANLREKVRKVVLK